MVSRFAGLLTVLTLFSQIPAQAQDAAGLPGGFLRIGVGPRALSLGGAFTAIADDGTASFWNAAGLAQLNRYGVTATTAALSLDRALRFGGAALPLTRSTTLGLSWVNLGVSGIEGRSGNSTTPDFLFSQNENALLLTVSQRLTSFLSIGANAKLLLQKQHNANSVGTGFDVAFLVKPSEQIRFGLHIQDVATTAQWSSGLQERYPLTYRGGVAIHLSPQLLVAADLIQTAGTGPKLAFGTEYRALRNLPVRAGLNSSGFIGGAGIELPMTGMDLRMDYAFGKDALDGTESHRFSLGMSFHRNKPATRIEVDRGSLIRQEPKRPQPTAVQDGKQVYLRVLARGLNVRMGPGVKYRKIGVILLDQEFKKISASGYWYKIELADGSQGWVHHKYVRETTR